MLQLVRSMSTWFCALLLAAVAPSAHADVPDQGLRLQQIGYRIARANASACQHPAMLDGLMLHDLSGYAPADREAMRAQFGLTGGFGIIGVVGDSRANLAGLREGDEIVALNGRDLTSFNTAALGKRASYARTESFLALLDGALQSGPALLGIRRGGKPATIALAADSGCGGRMALMHQSSIDAWSDGRYVAVTERLAETVVSDDELAFIVAHEMAHNILGHADRAQSRSRFFLQFGLGAGDAKADEIAADTSAVALMARAGFDPAAAASVLRRVSALRPMGLAITHPSFSRRIDMVKEAANRLQASNGAPSHHRIAER